MTNQEILNVYEFTASKKPYSLSENTIKTYMNNVSYVLEFVNKNISDITNSDIRGYLLEIDSKVSDGTYNLRINAMKSLYEVLRYNPKTENMIEKDPTDGLVLIDTSNKKRKKPLTKEEQFAIISNCKNKRDRAIYSMLISTGLRIHELINLTLDQYLNRDEYGAIYLEINKGSYTNEYVYINESTSKIVDEYLSVRKDGCEYLFVSNGGKQMDRTCVSRTLKTIARRSGAFTEDRIIQLSNHLLRHTKATNMIEDGIQIDVVARTLRHHGLGTVMTYVETSKERLMEANK